MDTINVSGIDKAELLASLYNNAQPVGIGFLIAAPQQMTTAEAQALLDSGQSYFDYLKGRVMKVNLAKDELVTVLYDRDNGQDAAYNAIKHLLVKG